MKTRPGYGSVDVATGLPHVMKLKTSIYRLLQSPRNWFNAINDSLKDMGFTSPTSDPCVYTSGTSNTFSMKLYAWTTCYYLEATHRSLD